jgi:hypothetical protein
MERTKAIAYDDCEVCCSEPYTHIIQYFFLLIKPRLWIAQYFITTQPQNIFLHTLWKRNIFLSLTILCIKSCCRPRLPLTANR